MKNFFKSSKQRLAIKLLNKIQKGEMTFEEAKKKGLPPIITSIYQLEFFAANGNLPGVFFRIK